MVARMVRSVLLAIALVLAASAGARAEGDLYTLAGTGEAAHAREGMPASRAGVLTNERIAALPGGGFLVGDYGQVWRVDPQGTMHLAAGTGPQGVAGDGGPAVDAHVTVDDLETLPGGGFLIADATHGRIRMVDPAGVITTVADGVGVVTGLAALPGGGFVFGDATARVREVGPDGRIRTIGSGPGHPPPHGRAATSQPVAVADVAVAGDGGVLVADDVAGRIDRIAPDGALTVALDPPGDERPTRLSVAARRRPALHGRRSPVAHGPQTERSRPSPAPARSSGPPPTDCSNGSAARARSVPTCAPCPTSTRCPTAARSSVTAPTTTGPRAASSATSCRLRPACSARRSCATAIACSPRVRCTP